MLIGGCFPGGECSYSSAKRDSSLRWAFSAALTQDRPGLRPLRRLCAHLFTVLESRPSSAQHSVVGLPVEMTSPAVPRGSAELQAMRRMIAAEVHRRLVSDCNGHGKRQVLARRWGRDKSVRGWQDSCAVHDSSASDGENAPWWQDVRAVHSPTALCGAFWIHSTHILPK